jgi:hypothetical protein
MDTPNTTDTTDTTDTPNTLNVIEAPFTPAQVESLNGFQSSGVFHPFTCGNDNCPGKGRNFINLDILEATEQGWVCPSCDYTQDWAHNFMADNSWVGHLEWLRSNGVNI